MLRENEPQRLINVIVHGSDASLNTLPSMPAFANRLNDGQIAQVANYVRTKLGGMTDSNLTANDIKKFVEQKDNVPFLIANAWWLTIVGLVVSLLLLGWLLKLLLRQDSR